MGQSSRTIRLTSGSRSRSWSRATFFFASLCVLSILSAVLSSHAQPEAKRITFYTPQTSYALPVFDRNNVEYVGLLEALEPMGAVSGRAEGKKYRLKFRDIEAQFEADKTRAKIHGKPIELPAPFLIENNRGLVPISSLKTVLPFFGVSPVDAHEPARRIFISAPIVHVTAKKTDSAKVTFAFSAPVNPFVATEPGKLRMVFDREPLQSDSRLLTFDDKTIPSASYSESNGTAELIVNGSAPMTASFSDDRKTITISAIVPQVQQTPAVPPTTGANGSTTSSATKPAGQNASPPAPKAHPFVIIDAAHGGTDQGAALAPKVLEKDVTLAIAHRLRHELEARGIACALVREGDASLTPDQRAAAANTSKAAVYVALHASSTSSGIRIYSSMLEPATRATLSFAPVQTVQAAQVLHSRGIAVAMTTSLLKHDMPAVSLPASIGPINSIAIPAIVVEIGTPGTGADDFSSSSFQQSTAVALANAIAEAQPQLPREVAQ
jgi:N-acetylmuramoyl-L-alanine amidase